MIALICVLDSIGIPNFSVFTGIKLIPIPPVYVFAKNRYTEIVFCISIELCVPVLCSCLNEIVSRCTPKIAVLEDIFYSLATKSHRSAHQPWISSPFFFISRSCVNLWIMLFVIQATFNAVTTLQNVNFTSVSSYRDSLRKWRSSSMHNTQQKWCNRHTCLSCKLCFNYPCMLLVLHEVGRPLTAELNLFLEVVFFKYLQ